MGRRVVFGVRVSLGIGVEEADLVIRFGGGEEEGRFDEAVFRFRGDGVGDWKVYCCSDPLKSGLSSRARLCFSVPSSSSAWVGTEFEVDIGAGKNVQEGILESAR